MKKYLSVFFLIGLMLMPVALIVGFSYSGSSHPIENRILLHSDFLNSSDNDVEVIFFGFPGCAKICPVSLAKLSAVLDSPELARLDANIGATFINVNQNLDEKSLSADSYSRSFSEKIRGYNPDLSVYRNLSEEFILRIYSSRTQGSHISHTDHFFVLQKQVSHWKIHRVLDNSVHIDLLESAITGAVTNLP